VTRELPLTGRRGRKGETRSFTQVGKIERAGNQPACRCRGSGSRQWPVKEVSSYTTSRQAVTGRSTSPVLYLGAYQLGTKASSSAVLRAVYLLTSGHFHSDLCGCLLVFTSLATCTVEDDPFWSDTALML
jgi:hypothetical protein